MSRKNGKAAAAPEPEATAPAGLGLAELTEALEGAQRDREDYLKQANEQLAIFQGVILAYEHLINRLLVPEEKPAAAPAAPEDPAAIEAIIAALKAAEQDAAGEEQT